MYKVNINDKPRLVDPHMDPGYGNRYISVNVNKILSPKHTSGVSDEKQ